MEGSTGYLILDEDGIIGYAWSTHNLTKNEGIRPFFFDIYPKKNNIYFYDSFIVAEKRGRAANTRFMNYRLSESKKAGFKKSFAIIEKHNLTNIKIIKRYGYKIEERISYRRYLWRVVKNISALEKVCKLQ